MNDRAETHVLCGVCEKWIEINAEPFDVGADQSRVHCRCAAEAGIVCQHVDADTERVA